MNISLLAAAGLILMAAGVHSGLGEAWIVMRLREAELPVTGFGGPRATKAIIRAAWHLLTLVWLAMATALLIVAVSPGAGHAVIGRFVSLTFAGLSLFVVIMALARGPRMLTRHPAGVIFGAIAVLSWLGAN